MIFLDKGRFLVDFEPEAETIITTIRDVDGVMLNVTERWYVNFIVSGLKGIGVWDKIKALYGFVGATAASHKWNWKDMRDLDEAFRLSYDYLTEEPTHDLQGIHFNNNSLAIITNDARKIFENGSGHISYYSVNNVTSDGNIICADKAGTGTYTAALYVNYQTYIDIDLYRASGGGRAESRNGSISKGFTLGSRLSFNDLRLYKDGILKAVNTSYQEGVVEELDTPLAIGGNIYTFRSDSIGGFASIGKGLTELEAIQMSHVITTAQAILGRQ